MQNISSGPASAGYSSRAPAENRQRVRPVSITSDQHASFLGLLNVSRQLSKHLLKTEALSKPCAIGITSALDNEGKTTVSISLASALILEKGKPAVVIEADLDNPTLADDFGLDSALGISNYLAGKSAANSIAQPTQTPNLFAVPASKYQTAGQKPTNALSKRLPELLAAFRNQFFFTIVDLPPLLSDKNTRPMLEMLDGVLLVVRAGVTPMEKFKSAVRELEGARLMGVVQIGAPDNMPRWLSSVISE